ncbi:flagellar filament capping protein FliD [Vibrio coralliirubri]|uniref:flagellar filament capping protein FliD n=1 Tax=Vibrio coralliirubri TaxID=1516159 RepID=UPI0022841CA1|nr:flagellar filament capping protein FliD [Vibrio coralliirubri]MCY9860993.1 flagellar filament capping protein FliD [Vibrio coralliirubri]
MSFSITGNNGGMVVSPDHYLQNQNNGNMGAGIVDSSLSNEDYGFSIMDNVEMMVLSKMGGKIPEIQSQITNANIQQGALSQFEITMNMLANNTIKPLNQKNSLTSYELSNSDPSSVEASISKGGIQGDIDLSVGVKQLAQSQSLKFGGFSGANDPLKAGSITIDFGGYKTDGSFSQNDSSSSLTIEITEGMTLSELAGAINKDSRDLKATVITKDDGTAELAIISQKTGDDNAMKISTSGDASLGSFNYNGTDTATATEVRKATDALYTVNGIEMSSPTNSIEDVFGLSLTLSKVTAQDIKISSTVSPDGVVENVTAFVDNFNSLMDMYNSFASDTPSEDFVGSLNGTDIAELIEEELDKLFSIQSPDGSSLKDLGISRGEDGTLSLDTETLTKALEKDPEIAWKILGTTTDISHDGVEIDSLGDAINGEHSLVITRKPEKAEVSGTVTGDVTIAADKQLKLKIGKTDVIVDLKAGTHSQDSIAAAINSAMSKAGVQGYKAGVENGALTITSGEYGSLQSIEVLEDFPELGLTVGKTNGVDISGTINGEGFLGDGASFESKFDEASKGMVINFDPDKIVLNETITIGTEKGFLDNLDTTLSTIKESTTSEIKEIKDSLDSTHNESLVNQLAELEDKEDYYYNLYYSQFSGVSAALSEMDSTIEMMDMMFNSED